MTPVVRHGIWSERFARLSTTAKLIVFLTFALMPLGLIALLASLQSNRTADDERRSELRVAATEASRKLATELTADVFTLRQAVRALEVSPGLRGGCAQADATLRARGRGVVPFALFDPSSTPVCRTAGFAAGRPVIAREQNTPLVRRDGDTLELIVPSNSGNNIALARYPATLIANFARPDGYAAQYRMTVDVDGAPILLVDPGDYEILRRTESVTMPVGFGNVTLTMTVSSAPFGAAEVLLTFLPLLMWASAAVIAFYVVDRLLIRPLKTLRGAVASYEPGSARRLLGSAAAIEIRELEEGFTAYADRLADREGEIERALDAQVKLTREVHHRVKNNLQVIASLISLHTRDAVSPDAERAYASIQRRVDALAIVHRNHFAELEANTGIEVKALLSELVASFRVNAKASGHIPTITLAAAAVSVTQDVATPLAFLFTELAEMALLADPTAPVAVSMIVVEDAHVARFTVASPALPERTAPNAPSSFRIIDGLARQLRSSLDFEPNAQAYSIAVPTLPTA